MNNINPSRKYLIATLIVMAFIFFQSSLQGPVSGNESGVFVEIIAKILKVTPDEGFHFTIRKLAHFTEYAILGITLGLLVWSPSNKAATEHSNSADHLDETIASGEVILPQFRTGFIAWLIGSVYAVTDELHQYLVPGRSCQVNDMLIDSAGVFFGVLLTGILLLFIRRTRRV